MLAPLRNPAYRHLFGAQVLSLIGTGLTTVALGLLAWDIAGANAGLVLGTALAVKMIAYVCIAPIAGALAGRFPRRRFLVALDVVRAGMVMFLPFVAAVWQIYLLVFLFQACSAAFTPTFQATIPDILDDETTYTEALSLSRLAYDLEALVSPMLAGLLLTVISFHWLFLGNAVGFIASAVLVFTAVLPAAMRQIEERTVLQRLTRGAWIYLATPRLQGLLALSFAVSSAGAMVIVNTVVFVRATLGGTDRDVAFLFAAYGFGSIVVVLLLPRLLARIGARSAMLSGGAILPVVLLMAFLEPGYGGALALWAALGAGVSLIQTPAGLLLKRSSHAEDRPALFAAQFALSHACWLIAYPLAGVLGARIGLEATFGVLAGCAALGAVVAIMLWPRYDPTVVPHEHAAVEHAHAAHDDGHHEAPHAEWPQPGVRRHRHRAVHHAHAFVIDDHHPRWPKPSRGDG